MPQPDNGGQPPQSQPYPGRTGEMTPQPRDEMRDYAGRGLLTGARALVTGGDSGIGRAVAVALAKEGADVAIAYLEEEDDAAHTAKLVEQQGRRCLRIPGDLADERHCRQAVSHAAGELGGLDVLVLHHGTQQSADDVREITSEQLGRTFAVNVHSLFWAVQAALDHMQPGGSIVITGSINGLRGNSHLIDYAASKAAAMNLAQSLAQSLADRGIRVNTVAPGPVWTPLNPADKDAQGVAQFGADAPIRRPAQPEELAPTYVFLASATCSSYITGEVIPVIGGYISR
jgi:NAD(P)-dependent dehydrogenase (short-subunit alcohol dehydrogenase family)